MLVSDPEKSWTRELSTKCGQWTQQNPSDKKKNEQVAEVYSLLRMVEAAHRLGMKVGFALEFTTADKKGNK